MTRAFFVWYIPRQHWTTYNGIDYDRPKRLSLEEAKTLMGKIIQLGTHNIGRYVVLEIDAQGKPILPKCLYKR